MALKSKSFSLATLAAQGRKSAQIAAHFCFTTTTKLLFTLCGAGTILLVLAAVLDRQGVYVPGNGLRWLYLSGAFLACMLPWSGLMDLVHTWLELRFFLRLAMLPSSQLLHKVWLNVLGSYIAFQQLFTEATVGGRPPDQLSQAETWVRRLLLCALLFTCVSVAVTLGCSAAVASLYSEGSRQKIVTALQHEYVMYRLIRDKLREDEQAASPNPDPPYSQPYSGGDQQSQWRSCQGFLEAAAAGRQWLAERLSVSSAAATRSAAAAAAAGSAAAAAGSAAAAAGSVAATVRIALPGGGSGSGCKGGGGGAATAGDISSPGRRSRPLVTFSDAPLPPPSSTSPAATAGPVGFGLGTAANGCSRPGGGAAAAAAAPPQPPASLSAIIVGAGPDPTALRPAMTGSDLLDPDRSDLDLLRAGDAGELDSDSRSDYLAARHASHGVDGGGGGDEGRGSCAAAVRLALRPGRGGGGAATSSAGAARRRRRPSSDSAATSYADLNQAMRNIGETDSVHLRRTMLAALEMYEYLREQQDGGTAAGVAVRGPAGFGGGGAAAAAATAARGGGLTRGSAFSAAAAAASSPHSAIMRELAAMRRSGVRQMINPRVLLDELLAVYGSLSDADVPALAKHYADTVWECAAPEEGDKLRPEDFLHIFPKDEDRKIAWDALDTNKDGLLTHGEIVSAVSTFLTQERSMALNVRAVRRLTRSLQTSLIAIVNGVFLMVAYLSILDVAQFFRGGTASANKTSLDIFSVYMIAVSLIFSEQIKQVLSGCVLILSQQPFDVGEELVIEESPGWRVMGIVQDFSLFFLRVKKSTDGELVTLPLNKLVTGRFTNLTRSDWKIEQNYFAVDVSTPLEVLHAVQDAALAVVRASPGEYDVSYGFLAVFHGFERPGKVVIRTFHRYKFNLSAAHKRIALARHGVMNAVRQTLDRYGIEFTELRLHAPLPPASLPYPPGAAAAVAAAAEAAATDAYGNAGPPPGSAAPAVLASALR